MDEIDKLFEAAVKEGRVHGAVLLARNVEGNLNVLREYGVRSLAALEPADQPPMTIDTPMRFASATKLLTSIMALQCVERGEITLDDTLERLLPEVAQFKVITSFDDEGRPVEREPGTPITVRHLLSHSAGVAYAEISPLLTRYRKDQGKIVTQGYKTLDENFTYPLIYDPGTDWSYSNGIDWCTRLIERASGLPAEAYLQKHLAEPLGITAEDMTFNILDYPNIQARRADIVVRKEPSQEDKDTKTPTLGKLEHEDANYWHEAKDPHGGQGIFTTPRAYFQVLTSILLDDGRLLSPEVRRLLFTPALTSEAEQGLVEFLRKYAAYGIGAPTPVGAKISHSVGGLLALEDYDDGSGEAWRRKGSLSWSGALNTFWNIDPEAGVCSLWSFHMKPLADPTIMELGMRFEKTVYSIAG